MPAHVVGRDAELEAIERWLDQPDTPILLLEGEAGIGKTTLWRAGITEARKRGYQVLSSAPAQSEARLSFTALHDLIGDVFDEIADELPWPQRHALAVTLLLEQPSGRPPDPGIIGVALWSTLQALAARAPTVVAIDDTQWLDAASQATLRYALRRLGSEPVRMLLARRSDGTGQPRTEFEGVEPSRLRALPVGALSLGAVHRLLRSDVGLTLPRPAVRRVHDASKGNPLFALEIGRVLKEQPGALSTDELLPVPRDVEELVGLRIKRLSEAGRDAVLAVALQGEPTRAPVEHATDPIGLAEALADGVLVAEGDRLRFSHPLFAQAAISLTPERRRRDMHLRLEALLADPEARAQHLALGTSEPAADVAAKLDRAAEVARRRGAAASAASLAEHAARLTPGYDFDAAARRTINAALWWTDAGDTRRCLALLEPLLPELPVGTSRLDALYAKARAVEDRVYGRLLEDAVAEAEGYPSQQVRLLFLLCYALLHGREFDAVRDRAQQAVEVAERTGDSSLIVLALSMAGRLDVGSGGLRSLHRARKLEPEATAVDAYESPATWLGWWQLANDELDAARRLLVDQHRRAADDGDDWNRTFLHWPLAELECRAGNYDAARGYAEAGLELAEQSDNLYAVSALRYCHALVAAHVGESALARTYAEESLADAKAMRSALFTARPRIALSFLAVSEGRYADALEHLVGLTELALEGPYWATYPFWGDLFEALVSLGELERAQALLRDIDVHQHVVERPGTAPIIARCRGLIRAASGSHEEAIASLEEALLLQEARPVPLERARSLLALGNVQRRARRRRAARETLRQALAIFEELGAELWAKKARAELSRIGGRTASSGDLTPTEERVAALVMEGMSNKEVAATLAVSARTVESALTSIYRKLDVRSRTEMARKLSAGASTATD